MLASPTELEVYLANAIETYLFKQIHECVVQNLFINIAFAVLP